VYPDLQAWVREVLQQVTSGTRVEDRRVELKAEWPDPIRAARRLAGHANAARGEFLLWLIGVDEQKGPLGASPAELSVWFSQVAAQFDGPKPTILDQVFGFNDVSIVALCFETGNPPYVVRNPVHGLKGGGPVEVEVPWREATSTRSASREDLLKILIPIRRLPGLELQWALLRWSPPNLSLDAAFYIVPASNDLIVLPWHTTTVSIMIGNSLGTVLKTHYLGPNQKSATISHTRSEALIGGPGRLLLDAHGTGGEEDFQCLSELPEMINASVVFSPAGFEKAMSVNLKFKPVNPRRYEAKECSISVL